MTNLFNTKCLVLDRNYQPIRIVDLRGAIYLIFREVANVINQDYKKFNLQEWISHSEEQYKNNTNFRALRSVNSAFGIPDVVILKNFRQKNPRIPACTKNNIIFRDLYRCQYCETKLRHPETTIDHVVPVSKGGVLSWENAVTSCRTCNNKKGNKDLDKCGLMLSNIPKPLLWDRKYFRRYEERFPNEAWKRFL